MDDSPSRWSDRLAEITDVKDRRDCGREFDTFAALRDTLSTWYDTNLIQGWRDNLGWIWAEGRVFEKQDGTWWSGISPLSQVCRDMSTTMLILFLCPRSLSAHTLVIIQCANIR